jgi:HK97 family phage portal protein
MAQGFPGQGERVSLFRRAAGSEQRAISSLPWIAGGDLHTAASSMDSQLGLVPVFAATRLISDSVAALPLQAFRKSGENRQPVTMPMVLDNPDLTGNRMQWVQRCMMSLLLRGNAYGLKTGFDAGLPKTITWLHPDKVTHHDGTWLYMGREVPAEQMFHIPALVLPGCVLGVSPLTACRTTLSAGLESQRFTSEWFRNKAIPGMTFQNTEVTVNGEEAAILKDRLKATLRAGEPFVTGKDWKLDVVSLSADDAGFVASAKLNASQIASIYGVPPEMIGGEAAGSLTYSTVELNQIQFLTNTLRPWLVRLEAAFSSLLPKPQYVRFNADAMIRAETKTRWEVHQIARTIGAENIDEIRALEELEPLPNGEGQDYSPLHPVAPASAPTPQGAAT